MSETTLRVSKTQVQLYIVLQDGATFQLQEYRMDVNYDFLSARFLLRKEIGVTAAEKIIANERIVVLSCEVCREGRGLVSIYSNEDEFSFISEFEGKSPVVQVDVDGTNRVFYVTSEGKLEATLVYSLF